MNDLRIPIGAFFSIVGILLVLVGLTLDYHAPLTDVNVNLYSGFSMLVFGSVMLWLARRSF